MTAVLEVQDVTLRFGGLTAIDGVTFQVAQGQILAVIGPNGAGKTSLFNTITGIYPPTHGRVLIGGREITRPLTRRTVWGWIAAGVGTGIVASLGVNLADLWTHSINDLFAPPRPFPWFQALGAVFQGLAPTVWTVAPFLIGTVAGIAGAASLWHSSRRGPDLVARAGVGRTFQNIRLFRSASCLDNVLVGMHPRLTSRWIDALFRLRRHRVDTADGTAKARELLALVGLEDQAHRPAGELPYGHQRRLEIARALALDPTLLLLDEPAAGMNPTEGRELTALIRRIRDRGTTCLLIEHDMAVVMEVSDRIVVLHYGRRIAEGTPAEIRADPRVIEAYLGRDGTPSRVQTATVAPGVRHG
jgi:branched-chain amino acid transport system ATP-binding protein